ncbi:MAG: hypothetical protein H0W83_05830 [Planctomycetes bacterium]|nr:hypothetical protein [Planctomycetota bacterium]
MASSSKGEDDHAVARKIIAAAERKHFAQERNKTERIVAITNFTNGLNSEIATPLHYLERQLRFLEVGVR